MNDKLEEYKLLIEIYYKEVNLSYTKATVFITIQLAVLAAVIAGYKMLTTSLYLFSIGIIFMMFLSIIQILMAIRANTVNEALIITLAEFEDKTGFTLLQDFSRNTKKLNRISKMNFPSYLMIFLSILFTLAWFVILTIVLFPSIQNIFPHVEPEQSSKILRSIAVCMFSMMYAIMMKISDLLDEHGLKLFKGASYFFSFLCAIFGCLLIISNNVIANIIFAMVMGFVVRKRIDYNNHILAFIIITSCFFTCAQLIAQIYFPFLFIIVLLGFLKDTKYRSNNSKTLKIINKIYLYVPIIYALPSLVYSIISSEWIVFFVFFIYDFSYNITRLAGERVMVAKKASSF